MDANYMKALNVLIHYTDGRYQSCKGLCTYTLDMGEGIFMVKYCDEETHEPIVTFSPWSSIAFVKLTPVD